MSDETGKLKIPPRKRSRSSVLSGQAVPSSSFLDGAGTPSASPQSGEAPIRQGSDPANGNAEEWASSPKPAESSQNAAQAPEPPREAPGGPQLDDEQAESDQARVVVHQRNSMGSNRRFQLPVLAPEKPNTPPLTPSTQPRPEKAKKFLHVEAEIHRLVRSVDYLYRDRLDLSRENDVWELILRLGLISFSEQYLNGEPVVDMSSDPRFQAKYGRGGV